MMNNKFDTLMAVAFGALAAVIFMPIVVFAVALWRATLKLAWGML